MIWKTTIKKFTDLNLAKGITLALLGIFLFNGNYAHAQFIPDGNYSEAEYAGGEVRDIDLNASQTCQVKQVYSIVKSDSEGPYLLLGFYNGNAGQATFRYYLDTDPNIAIQSDYGQPVGDADVVLQVKANGSDAKVFKYDGANFIELTDSGIAAEAGDFNSGDGKFIEFKVPLSGDESVVDICDLAEDFIINLGSYISFSGGSTNSSFCSFENIGLDVDANGTINGGTSYCSSSNSTTLTLSGNYGAVIKWQMQEIGSGWIDIANTTNTYTATNVSVTTNYRAIIVNNTCPNNEVETGIATITINEAPVAVINNDNGLALDCTTPSTTLTASGGTSYTWTNSNGDDLGSNASITVSTEDTFTVTVTGDNGCTDTASVSTTLDNEAPVAVINNNNGLVLDCTTPETTLTASGGTSYAWTNSNGDDLGSNASITVSTEDTFTVTVTGDNGCTDTASVSTTLDNEAPVAVINNDNGLALDCTTPSTTLTASGGTIYAWTNSNGDDLGSNASITVSTEDTFTVTVTADNGCTDTASVSTTLDNEAPVAVINNNNGLALDCTTPETTLTASGGTSYAWTNSNGDDLGSNASITVSTEDTFTVTVTADNGCTDTASVSTTLDNEAPVAVINNDNGLALDCTTPSTTLTASGGTSYAWTNSNGDDLGSNASITVSTEDTFTVTVTGDNGCTDTSSVSTTLDNEAPVAVINNDNGLALDCTTPSTTLTASGGTIYAWTNSNGDDLGSNASITVSTEDTFTVTVTADNGCTDTASVSTTLDNEAPVAVINNDNGLALDCTTPETTLTASGGTSYAWTNSNGDDLGSNASITVSTEDTFTVTVTADNGCTDTASVSTTLDNEAPVAVINNDNGLALDCTTPSTTLTASGGTSYAWTNSNGDDLGSNASITVSTEDTFTVTVTGDNGCTDTASVVVTKDDNVPTASITGNEELNCNTTEIVLDATGSTVNGTASYSWTLNSADGTEVGTSATLEVETPGTYFLTVTDIDNGCSATDSVEVTQDNTTPTAEAGEDMELTCTTTSVTLNGSGDSSNNDADLSYAWTGPEGFTSSEAMPSVSEIGTYTLTVTDNDNGCSATDTVTVTEDITAPTAEAGKSMQLTCTTTSVTLNGSGNSTNDDADLSYAWTGPGEFTSSEAMPGVTVEGIYTLTVTDNDNGCFATDTVEITKDDNVPTASITGNEELNCNTTEIILDATGSTVNGTASYSWTLNSADGTEVGTSATLEVEAPGTYFLTVTDIDNGCSATDSVEVTQDNTTPTAEAGEDMELTCTTTSVTLNGSGDSANGDADLSYAWTGPEGFTSSEAMPSVSETGTYTLTVTDNDNGCSATDTVTVTEDITAPTAEAGESMQLTCTTTSVTLNGSGNSTNDDADLSYAWTGPGEFTSSEAMPGVTVEGIYTLTVTDNDNGCFATDTVEITKDDNVPTALITGNEELNCNTTEIVLDATGSTVNGTASYSWTLNSADGTEVGTSATLEVETPGTYFLTVTDIDNGCSATDSVEVTQDNTTPTAEAGENMELTCTTTSVTLNGSGDSSNNDADLSYAWTGPEGFTSSEAMPSVSEIGTYTLTVTDNDNGCSATDTVTVTEDITAPTAEAGETMQLTCTTTSVTLNGSGNSTNNDADLSYAWTGPGEFTSSEAMPSVSVEGIYTLTVTDNDNGCFATDTIEITKDDNVPTASISGNGELNCNTTEIVLDATGSTVNGTASYSWTLNSADGTEVGTSATLAVDAPGTYFVTVTDIDNGCSAFTSVEVIFTPDTENPVITECASEVNVSANAGVCEAFNVELGMPTATDNCPAELTITNDAPEVFGLGETIVTWTITDGSGNVVQCEQIVNVTDDEAPVITECAAPVNVSANAGLCEATEVELGMPTATDNCDSELSFENNAPEVFPLGQTTVTWTVTDAAGNSTTCEQIVNVTDDEAPVITECAATVNISANAGVCEATEVELGMPTATDNCDSELSFQNNAPEVFPLGQTTVTWTVTDAAGNSTTCEQIVNVSDDEAPVITECATPVTVSADAGVCSATEVELGMPVATDNCDTEMSFENDAPEVFPIGETTVTWTITDNAGNNSTCTQLVTVIDDQTPIVETMDNMTVNTDSGICGAIVEFGMIGATDNCELESVEVTEGFTSGSEFPIGTTTVTWTVTDASGNSTTSSFDVTVIDNENPEITCPGDMTVSTEEGLDYAVVEFNDATAIDNCEVSVEQTAGPVSGSQFPIGDTVVTFTATDAAGNSTECSFTVTVEDNEVPTLECPSNMTQDVDAGVCGAVVEFETPAGFDNSGDVTVIQTEGPLSGEVFPVGTTTVTFTATDAAGNTATCSFTVTVNDDEGPQIDDMNDITVNTDAGICGAVVEFAAPGATDNCGVESVVLTDGLDSGSEFPVGETIITYTATDTAGNTATTSFTVTVVDNEAPSITCPENIDVTVEIGTTSVVVEYAAVTTTDNCEGTTVELTEGITSGEEFPLGSTTVTYTVTDASGNTATCTFTVNVEEEDLPNPPATPSASVTTAATCAMPLGTITVETQDGLTYSIDGENYQESGVFADLAPGTYQVTAQDEFGQVSQAATVTIDEPVAEAIQVAADPDLCIEDSVFDLFELLIGEVDESGTWTDNDNSGALDNGFIDPSMMSLGTYTFTYELAGTCPSSTTVTVSINDDCVVLACTIEDLKDGISKAVTPNGDNRNDFFEVDLDTECGFTYDLKIFNRWGAKVYDAQNYQNNWDGYSSSSFTSSNQLPSGTYYYVLQVRNSDFEPIQGYIYLGTK